MPAGPSIGLAAANRNSTPSDSSTSHDRRASLGSGMQTPSMSFGDIPASARASKITATSWDSSEGTTSPPRGITSPTPTSAAPRRSNVVAALTGAPSRRAMRPVWRWCTSEPKTVLDRSLARRLARSLVHRRCVRCARCCGGAPVSRRPCLIVRSLEDSRAHSGSWPSGRQTGSRLIRFIGDPPATGRASHGRSRCAGSRWSPHR